MESNRTRKNAGSTLMRTLLPTAILLFLVDTACWSQDLVESDSVVQSAADQWITDTSLRADIQFLADDLLEGRQPGTRGDQLAQKYLIGQFKLAGLQPALKGDNAWTQDVPLVGVTTAAPDQITFKTKQASVDLKRHDDFVVSSGLPNEISEIKDAEVLFVGYGIQAPEYGWDDFKDVDVRGKVLLVMNNDPAGDPEMFEGNHRLYYGRWDYKYAKAAELGAAGLFHHPYDAVGRLSVSSCPDVLVGRTDGFGRCAERPTSDGGLVERTSEPETSGTLRPEPR